MKINSPVVKISGLVAALVLSLIGSPGYPADGLGPGSTMPAYQLKMLDSPEAGSYLGLKGAKTFSLSQVGANLMVAEIFSVYCPVCQKNAPQLNQLFKIIQEDPSLSKNIKMMGIGLESDPAELGAYKQKFKTGFPLVSGPAQEIKKSVKFIPLLLVVDKKGKILMSHAGEIKALEPILLELRKQNKMISKQ